MTLAAYVSGHGFGHTTRVAEVLAALRRRAPDLRLAVVTSAPEALYRAAGVGEFLFRAEECDVGLVQRGALVIDEAGTVARWRAFTQGWAQRVEGEAEWLCSIGATAVLGDIPPLAFAAAEAAGIPGLALANFSWDWIYTHLARYEPRLAEAAEWARDGYRRATGLLRLPFFGDLSVFRRMEDVPLVARRPRVARDEARRRLGLDGRPAVLLSFGGIGLPGFDPERYGKLEGYHFLSSDTGSPRPANFTSVAAEVLDGAGLGYADLVGAADVVLSKPGYGIVTDCLGARTRLVYTDRGDFPEYPILVEQMARWLPCAYVTNAQLAGADITAAVESVLGRVMPDAPDLSGAETCAARLRDAATGRSPRAPSSRIS